MVEVKGRRGKRPKINDEHINFLKEWFEEKVNIGKPFKYAYQALTNKYFPGPEGIGIQ